jgi:hypothetical protein
MDTKGDVTKIPTIDTIVKKINNIFDDTDIVGKRKTNEENYKKMLKRLLNINDSDDIKPYINLETCTQNELGLANNQHEGEEELSQFVIMKVMIIESCIPSEQPHTMFVKTFGKYSTATPYH